MRNTQRVFSANVMIHSHYGVASSEIDSALIPDFWWDVIGTLWLYMKCQVLMSKNLTTRSDMKGQDGRLQDA